MNLLRKLTFAGVVLLLTACKGFNVDTAPLTFSAEGGTKSVFVESERVAWAATSSATWININPPSGNNEDVFVTITTSKNESVEARDAFVTFNGGGEGTYTVSVKQEGSAPVLLVNGAKNTNMNFGANKGDAQTVQITSNMDWSISTLSLPSWISVTPVNGGIGTTPVRISMEEDNNTPSERHHDIQIGGGNQTCTITVSQRSNNIADCNVYLANAISLSDAAAFQIKCDEKVKYYCIAILETVAASRYTEKELTDYLLQTERYTPKDPIFLTYIEGLDPTTSYNVYTIGIDVTGKHGSMKEIPITTKSDIRQPMVYINDVRVTYDSDGDRWEWNTAKGAYCDGYYQWFLGIDYILEPDIIVAWYFQKYIKEGDFSIVYNDASWWAKCTNEFFDLITWGCDRDKELAGVVNRVTGMLSDEKTSITPTLTNNTHSTKGEFKSCKLRPQKEFINCSLTIK